MEETKHTIDLSDRLYRLPLAMVTVVAIFVVGFLIYEFNSLPQNAAHEVSVSGEGKAYAKPDIAVIDFGVHTEAQKSQDAVNQNNKTMNAVIASIKGLGVQDKDIQTTLYNLQPLYNYGEPVAMMYPNPGKRTFNGYSLDQQIEVKIRNFDAINDILDKATAAGANTVGQLQFTVDDMEKFKAEARANAIAQAKEKATSLFGQSGLQLGKLVNVAEGNNNYPQPFYATAESASLNSTAPQIQTGQMEVDSTVTLTYQVK